MAYDFKLITIIKAPPQAIYDAWLDSRAHSAMTGGKATQSAKVGERVTAWDGYITGKTMKLVPGKTIVQTWRTTQFTEAHPDSIITVDLAPVTGGTQLALTHSDVPDGQTSYEKDGWQNHYFEPMRRYFAKTKRKPAKRRRAQSATLRKKGPTKKKPARAAKKTAGKKSAKKKTSAAKRNTTKRKTKKR
jgi:uncharacterized protein YndB with AHSA1/START domain